MEDERAKGKRRSRAGGEGSRRMKTRSEGTGGDDGE